MSNSMSYATITRSRTFSDKGESRLQCHHLDHPDETPKSAPLIMAAQLWGLLSHNLKVVDLVGLFYLHYSFSHSSRARKTRQTLEKA
jgi:hypothetical protein